MSANEWMTFMPPCSDFCKVVHSRRTLWVKTSFIDRCHQSHQLVFPFAVCWNDWRSESCTLYCMLLSLIWRDGIKVPEVLPSIHGFGWFVRGSWSWWAHWDFWQEPGAGKICTGYFCQEPIFLELFFGQVLWPCGLLYPLNRPFRHPCQFECGAIALSANSFSPFLLGIFRTGSLSWSFWQTDVLDAVFCSRNCAMCQLARMLYGRTFKWLIDAPLVWRVTFCDCCLDRFLRLNGIFVFLMASMSTITSCWCYEEKINDRLRESSTSQVHPSAWGVKLLFLESVERAWGDEECSSYTVSYIYIYIVYLISYTYTSVHIFS